jgi:hypothetical protein
VNERTSTFRKKRRGDERMRMLRILVIASVAVVLVAPPAQAQKSTYNVTLAGAEEVPGPGDPDGRGTAVITLDTARNELCYELAWQNIDDPTGAHIHMGNPGQSGAVMVDFNLPANGPKACMTLDGTTMGHVSSGPKSHYVNLHNASYKDGAVRGQLQR